MSFTYDLSHLTEPDDDNEITRDQHAVATMRLALGDTIIGDPKMQDEELLYFDRKRAGSFGLAVADAADAIAANYAHEATHSIGQYRVELGNRADRYRTLAKEMRAEVKKNRRGAGRFATMNRSTVPYIFDVGMNDSPGSDARIASGDRLRFESGR